MLSRGGLRTEKTEPEVAWQYEEKIERAAAISDQFEDQDPEDGTARTAETVVVDPYQAARAEALSLQPGAVVIPEVSPDDETEQVDLPPDDLDTFEQSPTEPPSAAGVEAAQAQPASESGFDEPQRAVDLHSPTQTNPLSGLEYMEVEGDFMDAFEEESLGYGKVPMPEAPQAPVAFDSGAEEDAEVISAFNDANEYRGGSKTAGHFVTETHNLDIVSLDGASLDLDLGGDDEDEEMEIEAEEVPAQSFGAPRLSEEDAQHKIDVANSVLEVIAVEYDKASGQGAGRAAVQLLLSGCPKKFAPLFSDVTADKQGRIIHHEVLRNLYARPASEHRLLLSQGVKDLLDRGMSVAAEELPDDGIDAVLEASAGLRQRLGL
jgi:hypothetical protein